MIWADGVNSIGTRTFDNCTNVTNVNIPASVRNIGMWAFSKCSDLKCIVFGGDVPSMGRIGVFGIVTATAYYPNYKETWTEDARGNYGGTITWVGYNEGETPWDDSMTITDTGRTPSLP